MWDFSWITELSAWAGLGTLVLLEVVLGVDNLVFISILVGRLPAEQKRHAFLTGLGLALLMRLVLLAAIAWSCTNAWKARCPVPRTRGVTRASGG